MGLDGLAFDFRAQSVLTEVGFGDVVEVEGEQGDAQRGAHHEHGNAEPVHANAACFESGDLILFGQDAKGDQHGHEDADRKGVVDQFREKEEQIAEDFGQRNGVLDDEAEQLEEVVDLRHGDEAGQQHDEVEGEVGEDVAVDDLEQRGPKREQSCKRDRARRARLAPRRVKLLKKADDADESRLAGWRSCPDRRLFQTQEKHGTDQEEETIGQPGREFRGDGALARHSGQADVSEVVDEEGKQDRE